MALGINYIMRFINPNTLAIAKSLAAYVNLSIYPLSIAVREQTRKIGGVGAAEAFSHYLARYEELSADKCLASFMDFYSAHWSNSCSQWAQDVFVMYITNCKHNGVFLEIGGADGFTHSNTYSLESALGWSGTLVEPDLSQFKVLQKVRARNMLIHAAIAPRTTNQPLRLRKAGQLSAIEGYEGGDMHENARLSSHSFETVRGISLSKLLAESAFDYLSLDVEGAELEILKNMDWQVITKPYALTIEHNFRESDRFEISQLLRSQGYVEHFESHDWLRRGDIWASLATPPCE